MFQTNSKLAFRNFRKNPLFSLINVIGLAIGICSALVIGLIVQFDFSFDNYQPAKERIYRVVTNLTFSGEPYYNGGVAGPLAAAAAKEVTGLELTVPFHYYGYQTKATIAGKTGPVVFKNQDNIVIAGKSYFSLLSYQWLAGTPAILDRPDQLVLTSRQAKLYFPELSYAQMMGKEVVYEDSLRLTVAGIVQEPESNTDFRGQAFISFATIDYHKAMKENLGLDAWTNTNGSSQLMLRLKPGVEKGTIDRQLNALLKKYREKTPFDATFTQAFMLQPLQDIHFNERYDDNVNRVAHKSTLYGLLVLAAFLLLLGCINFINLTTAQAGQRAKEIGIRKTMGSSRWQILSQFLSETFLVTALAAILAMLLVPLALRLFAGFIPEGISIDLVRRPSLLLFVVLLTAGVSLLSGFYPGIVLSGFKPIGVLKNQVNAAGNTRKAWLRKSLTVTQFVIAQFFIMATLLVSKQIYYMLHKDLGFKKDAIAYFNTPWTESQNPGKKTVLLNKLQAITQIEQISMGGAAPSSGGTNSSQLTYRDGKKEVKMDVQLKFGDENYVPLYHIRLLAGQNMGAADTSGKLLVNETYARVLGFRDVKKAVGQYLEYDGGKHRIIGVVADFYQRSLRSEIKPLAILHSAGRNNGVFHFALKPQQPGADSWKQGLAAVENAFKEVYPDGDFDYSFVDDSIAKFYKSEQDTSTLLGWATGLSIFISCMGLLGLAMYTTNLRAKEIGVRKVLGASVRQIVVLLSRELVLLVLLASALVIPAAWWAMNNWLQDFADRTTISWWIFAAGSAGMLATALLISGIQTVKAAIVNPVESLRME